LDPEIIKNSKIFEKAEIRWVCVDDLKKMRQQFRSYFQNIVDMILEQKNSIKKFIERNSIKKTLKKKHKKKGTRKM
jgi:transcription termination factor NusB